MKKIAVFLILVSNLSYCQSITETKIIPGSNLRIQLTKNFKPMDNFPGFIDLADSTKIFGFQAKMELSFKNAIKEQEKATINNGFLIKKRDAFKYGNFLGSMIEYEIPKSNFVGIIFIFGKENSQNILSSVYPKKREDEIRKMLLSTTIDDTLIVSKNNTIGFSTINNVGALAKSNVSAMVISYEERNEIGELVTNLKLAKLPKEAFLNVESRDGVKSLSSKYFPSGKVLSDENYDFENRIVGHKRVIETIKENGKPQYNYIIFIRLSEFDIMGVGSSNIRDNTKYMDGIVNSIRLE